MPSTAERVQRLVVENLEIDGNPISEPVDMNSSLVDLGLSSMDAVAFARLIQTEFNVKFTPDHCGQLANLSALVEFLDSSSG